MAGPKLKMIAVDPRTHERLDALRRTQYGTITYDDLIVWMLDKIGKKELNEVVRPQR